MNLYTVYIKDGVIDSECYLRGQAVNAVSPEDALVEFNRETGHSVTMDDVSITKITGSLDSELEATKERLRSLEAAIEAEEIKNFGDLRTKLTRADWLLIQSALSFTLSEGVWCFNEESQMQSVAAKVSIILKLPGLQP